MLERLPRLGHSEGTAAPRFTASACSVGSSSGTQPTAPVWSVGAAENKDAAFDHLAWPSAFVAQRPETISKEVASPSPFLRRTKRFTSLWETHLSPEASANSARCEYL